MSNTNQLTHKRGDTFSVLLAMPSDSVDGYFLDFDVACQVRDLKGILLSTAVCEWVDPATTRVLRVTVQDTQEWPIARIFTDVEFTRISDGWRTSTSTISILVVRDETHG